MNWEPLIDAPTGAALQLDWLEAALEPVSEYGRREFAAASPFTTDQIDQLRAALNVVARFAETLDSARLDALAETLRGMPDASGAIARAAFGDTLADADFLELQRFCDGVVRVRSLLENVRVWPDDGTDETAAVASALERGRSGRFGFYLDDAFDEALSNARIAATAAQSALDDAGDATLKRVAAELGRDDLTDEFIVMRDEVRGGLPSDIHVVRETPTYYLCTLELDDRSLGALARRDAAADAVARAEESVRARLSNVVAEHSLALTQQCANLGKIDVLIAKARFAQRYECIVPEVVSDASIAFEAGRYLPLADELNRSGRAYVPIHLALNDTAVLTGPNMGGKSAALRTCGFIAACTAFGVPVPASSARVGLFAHVGWLGIGVGDDHNGLLSSFAKEVVRLRELLTRAAQPMLMLVDEFARTTTPYEGKALLIALIEQLRARNDCALIATHLPGIATAARTPHFGVRGLRNVPSIPPTRDLAAALDKLATEMDYTIAEITDDRPPHADAIALAQLLGLDPGLIAAAHTALTGERAANGQM
ncbi:MAG: hypothetical protein M3Y21_00165 [Candidatus Eremiobacteraeota bacterium]|nr:hypothetical protein [Candidatus Eremiobacteraeota bacterium]